MFSILFYRHEVPYSGPELGPRDPGLGQDMEWGGQDLQNIKPRQDVRLLVAVISKTSPQTGEWVSNLKV